MGARDRCGFVAGFFGRYEWRRLDCQHKCKKHTLSTAMMIFDAFENAKKRAPKQCRKPRPPLLELRDIELTIPSTGKKLFDLLNFTVKENDCIQLIGNNGTGKPTCRLS